MPRTRTNALVVYDKAQSSRTLTQLDANRVGIHKKRREMQRRNSIVFENAPCFKHLDKKDQKAAQRQHEIWEHMLFETPAGHLYRSCNGLRLGKDKIPRQTLAWLIADFCWRQNVSTETLCKSITQANGDVHTKGLLWRRKDGRACANLHMLDDELATGVSVLIGTFASAGAS